MAKTTLQLPVIDLSSSDRLSAAKSIRQVSFSHFHNIRPLVNLVLTKDYSRFVLVNFLILFWHVQERRVLIFMCFGTKKVQSFFAPFSVFELFDKMGFQDQCEIDSYLNDQEIMFTCLL